MLRLSQIRGAMRIHDMIEASKWRAAHPQPRLLSDAELEYRSWLVVLRGVAFPAPTSGVSPIDQGRAE